jgi:hypothetical protein
MVSCFDSAEQRTKLKELEPALLFLTEAEQLLDKLDIHSSLNFAMEIVEEMARLDSERAYQRPLASVEEINKAGASKSGPGPYHEGPDLMVGSNLLANKSFSLLAEADFSAALALAQSIARPETSIAAQLAVCRGFSRGNSRPFPFHFQPFRGKGTIFKHMASLIFAKDLQLLAVLFRNLVLKCLNADFARCG